MALRGGAILLLALRCRVCPPDLKQPPHKENLWAESLIVFFIITFIIYFFFWSDIMINLFLVTPVRVINCVLLFYPPHPLCPLLLEFVFYSILFYYNFFFLILSGLSDAVVVSWLVKYQSFFVLFFLPLMLRLLWLMLHSRWVLFCFFVHFFCLCCRLRGAYWVWKCANFLFTLFSVSRSSYFINHRSVTQSKKMIQQCIFFTDIYLLVILMLFLFFWFVFLFICIAFLWRANRTQSRGVVCHWHFIIVYKIIYHTNASQVKIETTGFTVTVRFVIFTVLSFRKVPTNKGF